MKLRRPHIPLSTRVIVAARQLQERGHLNVVLAASLIKGESLQLEFMLASLFGEEKPHLDHEPAICLREIINVEDGIYKPDACDPRYLVYRTAAEHRIKTFVRGEGAQLSDAGKRRKEIRRKRKEEGSVRPSRWPPKGSRPLRWRSF